MGEIWRKIDNVMNERNSAAPHASWRSVYLRSNCSVYAEKAQVTDQVFAVRSGPMRTSGVFTIVPIANNCRIGGGIIIANSYLWDKEVEGNYAKYVHYRGEKGQL